MGQGIGLKTHLLKHDANGRRMTVTRSTAAMMTLCLGFVLGSCSTSTVFVSDHWPHWAGGEPNDVPPRPGTPGYQEFIAHKQTDTEATKPAATGDKPNAQAAASGNPPADDPATVRGGLY